MYSQWLISVNRDKASKVSAGSVGGTAECAPDFSGGDTGCGWVSGKVALVMDFRGFKPAEAKALVPKILAAMVTS
jgi:hypothetical protein